MYQRRKQWEELMAQNRYRYMYTCKKMYQQLKMSKKSPSLKYGEILEHVCNVRCKYSVSMI
jgi:hypothetical protein